MEPLKKGNIDNYKVDLNREKKGRRGNSDFTTCHMTWRSNVFAQCTITSINENRMEYVLTSSVMMVLGFFIFLQILGQSRELTNKQRDI